MGDFCGTCAPMRCCTIALHGVQPPRDEEVFHQASHEHTAVPPTVAEEAEDEVEAGLTLSHGPGKQRAHCLAEVLEYIGKAPLIDVCRRIHIVSAKMAVEGVVDMRVSETSAVDQLRAVALGDGAHCLTTLAVLGLVVVTAVAAPWERPRLWHSSCLLCVLYAGRGYVDGDVVITGGGHGACV